MDWQQDRKKTKQKHNTYMLDTTMRTQSKWDTCPPTNNWRQRRKEHRFYAEIVTDIKTQNPERKDT